MCGDEIATSSVTAQMVGGIPYNGLVKSKFVGLPTPLRQLVIDQFIGALTTAERRAIAVRILQDMKRRGTA